MRGRLACWLLRGHDPALSNLTATVPVKGVCVCNRCGRYVEVEARVVGKPKLRVVK